MPQIPQHKKCLKFLIKGKANNKKEAHKTKIIHLSTLFGNEILENRLIYTNYANDLDARVQNKFVPTLIGINA